jgi:hypothetical protein
VHARAPVPSGVLAWFGHPSEHAHGHPSPNLVRIACDHAERRASTTGMRHHLERDGIA